MNDDQNFLANAYVDGELTAEQRRIAEADPEVMAEVEQLRALQAELRDIPAPSDAQRESAIATAMAEFTGERPASRTDDDASAIPFRPRPSYARVLGVAAAVVAVAGLGIIVSQANLGGDDDDAGGDDATAAVAADDTADRALTESFDAADATAEMLEADGGDDSTTANDGEVMDEAAEGADESGLAASDEASEESGDEMAESAADADAGTAATTIRPRWIVGLEFEPEAPIVDERALGIYGVYLLDERLAERLPPSPNTRCGVDDEILDTAIVIVDEVPTAVYISVIEDEGLVFARDAETCAVVLVGSIFVS